MKINKVLSIVFITCLTMIFISCSSKNEQNIEIPDCVIAGLKAPSWACGTYHEDNKLLAVGSAPMSKLGYDFTRKEAIANARASLSQQIELEVKSKVETYMNTAGLKENESVQKVTTMVSKQTSNITLRESKQLSFWENINDNYLYVLIGIEKSNIDKNIDDEVQKALNELDLI
ncbi:LPP20 family lipoprotein [Aliarcobacter lanthieri]|uniref:LPP20 family lipoprotein n=1 Tax=Aliarcobacter lanthieri TaxID=1355374 RepID=UPI00047B1567|nr:LPP20 family lipoprotein [Aliarcobacter lanthieri]QKF59436.1 LPP20 family lipoprotein [Aliarcobacter lanthieri]